VEVNCQPGSCGEGIKDLAEDQHGSSVASGENEGVVGVLENGTRQRRVDWVANQTLKDVRDDYEEIGREGVALSQPATAGDPAAGHPV